MGEAETDSGHASSARRSSTSPRHRLRQLRAFSWNPPNQPVPESSSPIAASEPTAGTDRSLDADGGIPAAAHDLRIGCRTLRARFSTIGHTLVVVTLFDVG